MNRNTWDEILPDSETKERMFRNIQKKSRQSEKRIVFTPSRLIAVAAALIILVGVFTVNAVEIKEFFNRLFFVPGVGITENVNIKYEGLENPVVIQTVDGTFTLQIAGKTTRNGKSDLTLYIETFDKDYPVYIGLSANGEKILEDKELRNGSATWGADVPKPSYWYIHNDFPDVNEFILTICGVDTHIVLEKQNNYYALSKENNGITLGFYKFKNIDTMLALAIYDKNLDPASYWTSVNIFDNAFYDFDDEFIWPYKYDSLGTKENLIGFKDNINIKGVKVDCLYITYNTIKIYDGNPLNDDEYLIEIPVIADGERIKTDIKVKFGSYTYEIYEIWREGDTIYYTDNLMPREKVVDENGLEGVRVVWPFEKDSPGYKKAVENQDYFITHVSIFQVSNPVAVVVEPTEEDLGDIHTYLERNGIGPSSTAKMGNGQITNFNKNAKTLQFHFYIGSVYQFGDFNIEFE